ncbi:MULTISPECIES: DUF2262 domain-containing protein [Myroides]|uniref:DUF2262 domain-containing protein n=1 Tax=Myroides albus TaxID=2562892 RepID=A0A6I3LCM5_9FLAO|nr:MULTISPECIES: DUF2262 domain-containing protein [Myroides]MTG97199.1 hypothetical protein [Myroides albus]MVX35196.1 hypothetical protein [Myroides sp. LoEW2-1]
MKYTAEHFIPSEYDEQTIECIIDFQDQPVILSIYNGDDNLEDILVDVNKTMEDFEHLNKRGVRLITDELFDAYTKKSAITEEEFMEDIKLVSLYFTGDQEVEFTYEGNKELFGEHILTISLVEGHFEDGVAIDG